MPSSLRDHDIALVRAANPGPFTLSGTNTWVAGRGPAWVIDPGPALDAHLDAVQRVVEDRGGVGAILVTHDHPDHVEGVQALHARLGGPPVVASRAAHDVAARDGLRIGPLEAVATPGHAPDHVAYVLGRACFTGDAVLGEGSVFVAPDPGALADYLAALRRLRERDLVLGCPGHGPVLEDLPAALDDYVAHRLDRERRLLVALAAGHRGTDALLDAVWAEVPGTLRPAAAVTLRAHLDKLRDEGRLPSDVA